MTSCRRLQGTYRWASGTTSRHSNPQTYLKSTATGAPTFGGVSGFASNEYSWNQTHMSNAVSLKSDTKGMFDFDLSASSYNYLQDIHVNPYTVAGAAPAYSQNGKITRNDGTNWQNVDAKGICRPYGFDGSQEISFGAHGDRYYLNNPVYGVLGLERTAPPATAKSIRMALAKPAPARYGCKTPGKSLPR